MYQERRSDPGDLECRPHDPLRQRELVIAGDWGTPCGNALFINPIEKVSCRETAGARWAPNQQSA